MFILLLLLLLCMCVKFWHVCTSSSDCEWIFVLFAKETRDAVMPTVALAEQLQILIWKSLCIICCSFPLFWCCCPWQWSVRRRRWLTASMCARGTTRSTASSQCPRFWLGSLCSSSRAAEMPRRSSEQIPGPGSNLNWKPPTSFFF